MPQVEGERGTILLVEDDEAFGEVLRRRLAVAGYSVWIAAPMPETAPPRS